MMKRTPRSRYKTILIILKAFVSFRNPFEFISFKTIVIILKMNDNHNTIFSKVSLIITSFELIPLVNVRLTHYYTIFPRKSLWAVLQTCFLEYFGPHFFSRNNFCFRNQTLLNPRNLFQTNFP